MGFTTSNLSLYHTFSKTPVDSNTSSAAAQLGNAINKSGHTVQSNEIWTESIPFFGLAATTTAIHTKFSATAKVNDLVKDADGKIWQRNSTLPQFDASGVLTSTFADLWFEKTTSITSNVKVDGAYPTTDGALVDGSYLLNSEGIPTVKYYEKRLLTRLTADNNANTNSDNKASRLQIDGKWIDQFIGVTDIYLNGSAAVSYAPVLRKTESSSPMQAGPGKGYMDYCATGLILWESSAAGTEVIDCFEYVGAKLDATVAKLSAAVFGSSTPDEPDAPASLSEQVTANTAAINVLKGADTVEGSIANSIKTAIENLGDVAVKSDITITEIKVKSGSTTTTLTPDSNKSVTVEIPEVQAATTDVAGVVTISDNDAIATTETSTAAATVAAVAATRGAIAGEMGALATSISTLEGTVSGVKTTAESAIQTVKVNGTELTKSGTEVDITAIVGVDETVTNGINVTKTADNKVKVSVTPATYTSKTWGNTSYFATAADVASAISDAVNGITIPSVTTSSAAQTVGVTASGHEVSVATADYTASTDTWTNKSYLVTGATVETFVNDVVSEVSSDLTTLENKVNAYHKAGVSYKVYTSTPLPDLSIEDNVKEYKNVILLVPKEPQTGSYFPPSAISGDYTEYLCVNKGTEEAPNWDWEQIGTTQADLTQYAKVIGVNGRFFSNSSSDQPSYIALGSFASTVADGQATTLDNQDSVYANIATDGTLTLGVASATDTVMGVSKMFTGDIWKDIDVTNTPPPTDTAVSVKSVRSMYSSLAVLANSHIVSVDANSDNTVLTGFSMGVSTSPSKEVEISVKHSVINSGSLPATAKVVANGLIDGTDVIETEKINFGLFNSNADNVHKFIPENSQLTTWVGDMPNLQQSSYLFMGCSALTSFCGDLSSLTDSAGMFDGCTNLESFCGDLSSLTVGARMFYSTYLSEFDSDLSSLTDGTDMFSDTHLSLKSIECIADTIATNENSAKITIIWKPALEESVRQEYVDVLSRIVDKGWALETNQELISLFDSEKYEIGFVTVQPLDLESEPQTVYYVIKK